uniref:Uncharacterized protein n=1 Tax=Romanomermis culicivorax TaxID=13658 RepID=A0A915KAC5_ROMCU
MYPPPTHTAVMVNIPTTVPISRLATIMTSWGGDRNCLLLTSHFLVFFHAAQNPENGMSSDHDVVTENNMHLLVESRFLANFNDFSSTIFRGNRSCQKNSDKKHKSENLQQKLCREKEKGEKHWFLTVVRNNGGAEIFLVDFRKVLNDRCGKRKPCLEISVKQEKEMDENSETPDSLKFSKYLTNLLFKKFDSISEHEPFNKALTDAPKANGLSVTVDDRKEAVKFVFSIGLEISVSHGSLATDHYFATRFLFQLLGGHSSRTQDSADKYQTLIIVIAPIASRTTVIVVFDQVTQWKDRTVVSATCEFRRRIRGCLLTISVAVIGKNFFQKRIRTPMLSQEWMFKRRCHFLFRQNIDRSGEFESAYENLF